MKFMVCPYCGDHLDIGERCDCQKDKDQQDREAKIGPGYCFDEVGFEKLPRDNL